MNCKQGDLAFVINDPGFPENDGALVKVERLPLEDEGWFGGVLVGDWVCTAVSTVNAWANEEQTEKEPSLQGEEIVFNDRHLRPIRPSEGQDETLSWKDVPQGEIA